LNSKKKSSSRCLPCYLTISHALPPSGKGKSVQAQQRHSTENPHPFLWEPDATFVTETTHYPTEQQVVATINGPIGQRRTASFAIGTESGEQLGDAVGVRSASLEADLRVRFSPRCSYCTCTVTHEMTKWLTRGHMRRHMDGSARADTYGHTTSLEVGTEFLPLARNVILFCAADLEVFDGT
jgi:hypothetical protein